MKQVNNTRLNRDLNFKIDNKRYAEFLILMNKYIEEYPVSDSYANKKMDDINIHSFIYYILAKKSSIGTNTIEKIIVDENNLDENLVLSKKDRTDERINTVMNFFDMYKTKDLIDFDDFKQEVKRIHKELFKGIDRAKAGKFKKIENFIPEQKKFLDPKLTEEELDKLGSFIVNSEIESIALAAIAHAKFIEIHPFSDGNGRLGRLISNKIIEMSYGVPLWIDEAMSNTLTQYISALDAFSFDGVATEIVNYFIEMSIQQINRNMRIINEFKDASQRMSDTSGIKLDICQYIISKPFLNIAELAKEFNIHRNTAKGYLEKLVEDGYMKKRDNTKLNIFIYKR